MSGLAGILARRRAPGIYLWHSAYSAEEIRHTVEHAGQHFAHVDGWRGDSKADFLAAIGQALDFPDYYGQNFDALADCLHDVAADTVLLWDGWGPLAREDERAFSVALSVLGSRVNADRGGAFTVLLRGDGPELPGIEELD
ncbi:MAG: barstar family protein [Nocardioides sp.]|jgi:RNAse (barnase) inhibitor barstar